MMYLLLRVALVLAVISGSRAVATSRYVDKRAGALNWVGVNLSGAEWCETCGSNAVLGVNYQWPSMSSIDTFIKRGMNIFRIPFLMERMVPGYSQDDLGGAFDETYLGGLRNVVTHITQAGQHAVIDAHNYGRYDGNVITNTDSFKVFWKNLAGQFADNALVIFDCNNEPHNMAWADNTFALMQACIDGAREAGATSQYIFVEGNLYSSAGGWPTAGNDNLANLKDPSKKIVYEMHQYLDPDSQGKTGECANATIGSVRVKPGTAWLAQNGKQGVLGEFAGGANDLCYSAIEDLLAHMVANSQQWLGAIWWAAGPIWPSDYPFDMEPNKGVASGAMEDILLRVGKGIS